MANSSASISEQRRGRSSKKGKFKSKQKHWSKGDWKKKSHKKYNQSKGHHHYNQSKGKYHQSKGHNKKGGSPGWWAQPGTARYSNSQLTRCDSVSELLAVWWDSLPSRR